METLYQPAAAQVWQGQRTLWLRTFEDHATATATTTGTLQIGQGDPRLDEYL